MKIKIGLYTVEQDRNGYMLTEDAVATKGKNIGEKYQKDQTYPATLEKCLQKICFKEKANSELCLELKEAIEEFKKIDASTILEIKEVLGKL